MPEELATIEGAVMVPAERGNLFATQTGRELVERATEMATALAEVVRKQKLSVKISGREHVRAEGWTMLGSMLGVFPVVESVKELRDKDGALTGFEARVEARTLSGATVGAALARCTRDEKTWKTRDEYALLSMAQTRGTSKALRLPLEFVMSLAGFDPTPLEEMPHEDKPAAEKVVQKQATAKPSMTKPQQDSIKKLVADRNLSWAFVKLLAAQRNDGVAMADLDKTQGNDLVSFLEKADDELLEATAAELGTAVHPVEEATAPTTDASE
jgi:hypothetical protein